MRQEEEKRQTERQIDQAAPEFWKDIVDNLKSFIEKANQELGKRVFSGTLSEEGSTFSYAVTCDIGSESALGGVSWNRTQRQIALTVRGGGGADEFALAIDESDTLVACDSTGGAINNADDLVQLFVRRLTEVESPIRNTIDSYRREIRRSIVIPTEDEN